MPVGYEFIACLTHDVDHPSIRLHKVDHTTLGFVYRGVFGSVLRVLRGQLSLHQLLTNWMAVLKLPFVHVGLAEDFWDGFDDYAKLEDGLRSSFFVIPFKDSRGRSESGLAPSRRASRYGVSDIADKIGKLISAGCEIGLHGIDAWLDSASGSRELKEIQRITGTRHIGVRMHWLYFNEQSPAILENAGFDYDSTVGYNETIGYRAGTSQVYRPLQATTLLELPLHIMDTALFYPSYLDLSPEEARKRTNIIIENAVQFGGSVTVNWHDRSIAPERLWGDFYVQLIADLKDKGAWFATAGEAVAWFRKRRSATFTNVNSGTTLSYRSAPDVGGHLPNLTLRVHSAGNTPRDSVFTGATPQHAHFS